VAPEEWLIPTSFEFVRSTRPDLRMPRTASPISFGVTGHNNIKIDDSDIHAKPLGRRKSKVLTAIWETFYDNIFIKDTNIAVVRPFHCPYVSNIN
jgi:hypothetical protein